MRNRFVSLRGLIFFAGLMMMGALVAPSVAAQIPSSASGDSYTAFIVSANAGDTAIAPGGILPATMNTVAAFRVTGGLNVVTYDTLVQVDVLLTRIDGPVLSPALAVSSMALYLDNNLTQLREAAAEPASVGTATFLSSTNDTALYRISSISRRLTQSATPSTETYVVVLNPAIDSRVHGMILRPSLPVGNAGTGAGIGLGITGTSVDYSQPNPTITFPQIVFRVDSVAVSVTDLGTATIHPDSRVGRNPFTVFSGTIQGETRSVYGDSLTRIGVAFQGNCADSVANAWVLLGGRPTDTIPMTRVAPGSWQSALVDSKLLWTQNRDTFLVKVMMAETVQLGETIAAYIPQDSIMTRLRFAGPSANSVTGGTFTLTKQRVVLQQDALPNISRHPDSTAVDGPLGILALSGRIAADTYTGISADSVQRFGVHLLFTGGMNATHIDSVGAVIAGETFTLGRMGATDTWEATVNKTITDTGEIRVYVRAHAATPANATMQVVIAFDSVTTRFRQDGPSAALVSNRTVTYQKQRVSLELGALSAARVHPDSRAVGGIHGILLCTGVILADSFTGITADSVTHFGVSLNFGGGMAWPDVESAALVVNGETFPLARLAGTDSWSSTLGSGKTIMDTASFQVWLRARETTPVNATVQVGIMTDSISTRFRLDGPSAPTLSSRICTYDKQRIVLQQDALLDVSRHPDSTAVDGKMGVLALSGRIAADTVSEITADTVQRFGVGLLFTGMNATHIDSVGAVIAGETFTLGRVGATDTWEATVNRLITDTAEIRIYVRAHLATPANATVRAVVALDSVTALFRLSGPTEAVLANRTITYQKQRVTLQLQNLGPASAHPDSRVTGGVNGVLLCSGVIVADTFSGITADSVTHFGVSLNFGGGMAWTDVETAALVVNGETFPMANLAGTDSWSSTLGTGKTITDTASFQVWLRARETTPVDATVRLGIMTDSISTRLRTAGPSDVTLSDRTCTFTKQRVILQQDVLDNITRHPDSTAIDGQLGILALSGRIAADTVSGITADSVQRLGVNLIFGGGMAAANIDSVGAVISGETFTLGRIGATDTWEATVNKTITDTAEIRIYVRAHAGTPNNGTVQAVVAIDSVTALFRQSGPAVAVLAGRTVTYQRQRVTLLLQNLGAASAHPDSRITGGLNGVMLCSGVIMADTFTGMTADSVTRFGVSLNFGGGMAWTDVETALLVVNGETFPMANLAGTDSWSSSLGSGKTIMDTASFQVWLHTRETTPHNATVRLGIMTDSISTRFRTDGPSDVALSDRTCTFAKPRIDSNVVSLTLNGYDTYHPRLAATIPFVILRGTLTWDTLTVLTGNRDTLQAFTVFFAGTAPDSARSVQMQINASGSWVTMNKVAGTETTYIIPAGDTSIIVGVDTYAIRITVADSVTLGESLTAHVLANGCTSVLSRPGPAANSDSSGIFKIASNPVVVRGTFLGDTKLAPWSEVRGPSTIGFETNPVIAFSGAIHTNIGPVRVPSTDTLTRFGVIFDSVSARLTNDSFVSVTLRLWDTSFATFRDTLLIADSSPNPSGAPPVRLWRLQGDTIITETQPFQIIVRTFAHERLIGESFFVRVGTDSARTFFSSAPGGDTHSGRVVTLSYPDTTRITLDAAHLGTSYELVVNPTFETSAILTAGAIRGLQWNPQVRDTVTSFKIEVAMRPESADSITAVTLLWGATATPFVLTAGDSYTDGLLGRVQKFESAVLVMPFSSDANFDTFAIRITVRNSIMGDALNSFRSRIWGDSIGTYYNADSAVTHQLVSSRNVTFRDRTFSIAATLPTLSPNVTVSPFRAQTDSIAVLAATITSSNTPSDSLSVFGVKLSGSAGFRGESVQVLVRFGAGSAGTALYETTLILMNADSPAPTFLMAPMPKTVDSGTAFVVYVRPNDKKLVGETVTASILSDSIKMLYSSGSPTITADRTIVFALTDTVVLTDLTPSATLTVHPDSRMNQKPFIAYVGAIRGQTSKNGLADTLTRIGFEFLGNAATRVDSAWISVGADSLSLAKSGTSTWSRTMDSTVAYNSVLTCTLWVWVADTTLSGETLHVRVPADSVQMFFCADTAASAGLRTVTFDRSRVTLTLNALGETTVHPDSRIRPNPITVMSGRLDTAAVGGILIASDTLTSFAINLGDDLASPLATADIESAALVINSTETVLTKSGLRLTWAGQIGIADSAAFSVKLWVHPTADAKKIRPFIGPDSLILSLRESGPVTVVRNASDTVNFVKPPLRFTMGSRPIAYPYTIQSGETKTIAAFVFASDYVGDSLTQLVATLSGNTATRNAIQNVWLVRDANNDSAFTYGTDTIIAAMTLTSAGAESRCVFTRVAEQTVIDTRAYMIAVRLTGQLGDTTLRISVGAGQCSAVFMGVTPASNQNYDTFRIIGADTSPAQPVSLSVSSLSSKFNVSFPQSTDTTSWENGILGGQYNIYIGSKGGGAPSTVIGVIFHDPARSGDQTLSIPADSITTKLGVAPADGDSYSFKVTAQDLAGNEGIASVIVTGVFRAAASPPEYFAEITAPLAGQIVFRSSSIQFTSEITNTSATATIASVRFLVTNALTGASVADQTTTESTFVQTSGGVKQIFTRFFDLSAAVAETNYLVRSIAQTATGSDTYAASTSFRLTTSKDSANYVSTAGTAATGDTAELIMDFPVNAKRLLPISTPSAGFDVIVSLPANALGGVGGMVRCTAVARLDSVSTEIANAIAAAGIQTPRFWTEFTVSGDTMIRGGNAYITISGLDANGDGICDSTGINLRSARIYTIRNGVLEALNTRWDAQRRILVADLIHFSPFFISNDTGTTTAGLTRLIVGPNPYRPNDGSDQTGKPYNAADNTTGIIFRNLPPNVKIEIFTILGEKVIEVTKNSVTSGQMNWSGKNTDGRDVASGYYLYVVTDQSTGQRVTGKVAVIR